MYSQSWEFRNGPMKSIPQTSNSSTWRLYVRGIVLQAVMPPCSWHLRHLRINSLVSSYIVGQKKPLCQIFCLCSESSKVASIRCSMAFLYDLYPFCCRDTSPQQSIRTHPVQVRWIPKVT